MPEGISAVVGLGEGLELTDGIVGVSGQFIAAVLETAGVHGQAQILESFSGALHSLGAFLLVWALVGGIFSFMVFGNYKRALYLLIGPPLFLWMLSSLKEVEGAAQQFGVRRSPNTLTEQRYFLHDNLAGDYELETAHVSRFFVLFDRLVSTVVQSTVNLIVDTENNEDQIAVARERVYQKLFRARASDMHFVRLLSLSLMGSCGRQLSLAQQLASPRLKNAPLDGSTLASRQRLAKMTRRVELADESVPMPIELRIYLERYDEISSVEAVVTCDEVWEYTKIASLAHAEKLLRYPPPADFLAMGPKFEDDLHEMDHNGGVIRWNGAQWEDSSGNKVDVPPPASAEKKREDFWNQTYEFVIDKLRPRGGVSVSADVARKQAFDVFAAFFLRNSVSYTAHSLLSTATGGREHWRSHLEPFAHGEFSYALGATHRLGIVHFSGIVPYFQGLMLYVLSLAFPFFCLFLLIPGRATQLLVWMSLWVWVKSWDVGFAFVYFMRNIFWEFMPNAGGIRTAATFEEIDWTDTASVLNIMHLNDPTSNLTTYYVVIGLLHLAIPVITAQFCLGAMGFFSPLKGGITGMTSKFMGDTKSQEMRKPSNYVDAHQDFIPYRDRIETMQKELDDPGVTKWGRSRAAAGDGTPIRAALAKGTMSWWGRHFTRQFEHETGMLAAASGRPMPWGHIGIGNHLAPALALFEAEKFEVPDGRNLMGPVKFWATDENASREDLNVGLIEGAKGAETQEVTEGAGEAGEGGGE